jgi:hypothetical protein
MIPLVAAILTLLGSAAIAAYLAWVRPRQLRWGATDAEVKRSMPGDEIVQRPTFNATRAVSIQAPPQRIWPWIVQMGFGRAGWYSHDWIDNLGRHSAERIIPEAQHVAVGDLVPMGPGGFGLQVKSIDHNRSLVWGDKGGRNDATWAWGLYPVDGMCTRLITRVRIRYRWMRPSILFHLAMDVGDIVMTRKCMLGIKRRAEAAAPQ